MTGGNMLVGHDGDGGGGGGGDDNNDHHEKVAVSDKAGTVLYKTGTIHAKRK